MTLLDVRPTLEYDAGHIEGSEHIPIGEIKTRSGQVGRDKPIVVVCQIGQRSALVASFLREEGYDAVNLVGGLAAWSEAGFPLVSDATPGKLVDGYARDIDGEPLNPKLRPR